jgi:hypothetical protein
MWLLKPIVKAAISKSFFVDLKKIMKIEIKQKIRQFFYNVRNFYQ